VTAVRRRQHPTKPPAQRGGRPQIDWSAAKLCFIELGPVRSYTEVARQFGVSLTAVRNHAKAEDWPAAAQKADADAEAAVIAKGAKTREQRISDYRALVDDVMDSLKQRVDEAKVSDLPSLLKVLELLEGEPTERVSFDELQSALRLAMTIAVETARRVAESHLNGNARVFVEEYRLVFMADFEKALGS
jgi:hypothetical protein